LWGISADEFFIKRRSEVVRQRDRRKGVVAEGFVVLMLPLVKFLLEVFDGLNCWHQLVECLNFGQGEIIGLVWVVVERFPSGQVFVS